MKKTAAHSATSINNANTTSQHLEIPHFGREFFDTTWRIALPVVFFALLGLVCDAQFGTKPWLVLLGVVIGFVVAGALVKRQANDSHER